jgi:eukaryotic-like serine/threonine-protein kinase
MILLRARNFAVGLYELSKRCVSIRCSIPALMTEASQPQPQDLKKRRRLKWLKIGAIVGVSLFALLLLFDLLIMPLYVKRGEVSIVPKVVGKPLAEAMQILADAGYEPNHYETQFSDKAKEGTIMRQTPEGGDETKPGRRVYLIVSGGKEMVIVPNFTGLNLKDARISLVRANLELGKTELVFTDSAPSGIVFRQYPRAGEKTSTSRQVTLYVSQGPRTGLVVVPSVLGVTLEEAIRRIGNSGLTVGQRSSEPREHAVPGTVFDQYPPAGDLVPEGSAIELFLVEEGAIPPPEE